MIRLTDEEIEIAVNKWKNEDWATRHIRLNRGHYEDVLPVIAKAQLKKVMKWGISPCYHEDDSLFKRECPHCWQALLEETK